MSDSEYKPEEAVLPTGAGSEDEVVFDDTPLKKFPKIEKEDIYGLALHDLAIEANPFEPGTKRRVWKFAVDGFDPEECGVLEYYAAASGRGSNNEAVAEALEIEMDGPVKVKKSDLIGRKCRGMVAFKSSKRSGKRYPKIEKLLKA